jgi:hypothetical protein
MAESSEAHDQAFPHPEARLERRALATVWRKIRHCVARSVFWAYERGGWQYDLIVLFILVFILLSPRAWFNDRPTLQLTDLRHQQGVVELSHGKDGWRYMVDARLVESLAPDTPEDAIQEILRLRLRRPFTVKSIVPVRDKSNVILGYTVTIVR